MIKKEFINKIDDLLKDAPAHFNSIVIPIAMYYKYELEVADVAKYIDQGFMVMYAHSKPDEILLLSMSVFRK